MIELSLSLDMPIISLIAVTIIQKIGLERSSVIVAFSAATAGLGLFSDDGSRLRHPLALGLRWPAVASRSRDPTAHLLRASYRLILVAVRVGSR